ncbi:ER membrane protein complex subunit 7 homolog [Drosophila tropicalis]|uniref:ER membrane protein complex subunit 7 homolog n=1 Tax=Drosophila tropicalis TaxID=46794 RepID=UPI0035AB8FD5
MYTIFGMVAYLCLCIQNVSANDVITQKQTMVYSIEGVILQPESNISVSPHWLSEITLSINSGEYKGFVREDGRFVVSGVPHGSYVMFVDHPDLYFPPVRVEIIKGKLRARQVNFVQTSLIVRMPYPLRLRPWHQRRYFHTREQWRIVDVILSPMFLVMVVPWVLMLVLPKLINDPETMREIENIPFPKLPAELPDLSEMLTSFLAPKQPLKDKIASSKKSNEKRN